MRTNEPRDTAYSRKCRIGCVDWLTPDASADEELLIHSMATQDTQMFWKSVDPLINLIRRNIRKFASLWKTPKRTVSKILSRSELESPRWTSRNRWIRNRRCRGDGTVRRSAVVTSLALPVVKVNWLTERPRITQDDQYRSRLACDPDDRAIMEERLDATGPSPTRSSISNGLDACRRSKGVRMSPHHPRLTPLSTKTTPLARFAAPFRINTGHFVTNETDFLVVDLAGNKILMANLFPEKIIKEKERDFQSVGLPIATIFKWTYFKGFTVFPCPTTRLVCHLVDWSNSWCDTEYCGQLAFHANWAILPYKRVKGNLITVWLLVSSFVLGIILSVIPEKIV